MRRRLRPSAGAWFPLGYIAPWPRAAASWLRFFGAPPAWLRGSPACLPSADVARHVFVAGLTGAHKTTALILPALLAAARARVSIVAFDLKYGERDTLAAAAPEWWRHDRSVLVFAPLDSASLRWNPLGSCRSLGSAHEFAAHLFPDDSTDDPDVAYWAGAERHVCATLVWALVSDGLGRSVGRLRTLAEAGPDAVFAYVNRHPHAPDLTRRLGAYRAMMPKDQAGILQGIAARLDAWADDRVSRATGGDLREGVVPPADVVAANRIRGSGAASWDVIDLDRIRREPTLLLVGVPQAALPRLRGLCQLLIRDLTTRMLRPRGPGESVPVLLLLEELPAWGRLPQLADHLATFRSRDVAIVATAQSDAQGQMVYGSAGWAAVAANFVTKIYFPSLADPDAERLSRALGTAVTHQVSRGRAWGAAGRQESEHSRLVDVPLRRPEALQGVDTIDDEIVVRCPRLPPALLWCPPYYVRPASRDLVPDVAPSTFEIAIRHRLKQDRPEPPAGVEHDRLPARRVAPPPPSAPISASDVAGPGAGAPAPQTVPAPDEVALSDLVRTMLKALSQPDSAANASAGDRGPRIVCRANRPVEIRLDPEQAFRLLGGGETADAIIRRWAARRWVKRIRPTFVLEKRAVEALDQDLQRRLASLGATSAPRYR